MDFGISFLSNNLMLPILDFFYGIVPSYGLAIVALTLVIRFALYPLNAGSLRNMRRMKVAQPLMKERVEQIQKLHKDNPAKQQEEMSKVYKEFGNPLAGCFPLLVQMPVLFALFATLRGSPFSDVNYTVNLQVLPQEQIERVQPQAFATPPQNIYIADSVHAPIIGLLPGGDKLGVGEKTHLEFQTVEGKPLAALAAEYDQNTLVPHWKVIKGEERVQVDEQGNITALEPGDATIQGTIPGLATNKGFLFIEALGRVGAIDPDGKIHWDILVMILGFGISLYVNQTLSGQTQGPNDNPQQATINKLTPVIFSGMFLFFPLPAGVLMYMLVANIFQTVQAFILSREPLPDNLQKIVDEAEAKAKKDKGEDALPFEPGRTKKKA
ncbi:MULTISPECIES: membrane protein insertase YidC [Kamptonema]|uniref:membrane protein insertase YidC n=1 Tax=Kamptonema TaxID=1501433 RepID=UPI0002D2943A|nr:MULTISPECIES: membrane protein insertase YidC [Kamptonema]